MKNPQGLFHLLSFLGIPVVLACFFLWEIYWLGTLLSAMFIFSLVKLFQNKD